MRFLTSLACVALPVFFFGVSTAGGRAAEGDGSSFGEPIVIERATPLAEVMRAPERFAEAPILLRGRLTDVCQKKGCWTILKDGDAHIRVRFLDYGFFLPREAVGDEALAEGRVTVRTISQKEARHYEAEASGGDPGSIRGPQREVAFTASGVRLLRAPGR
jgi:hypothetical protein